MKSISTCDKTLLSSQLDPKKKINIKIYFILHCIFDK